jgi:hypothetical protein
MARFLSSLKGSGAPARGSAQSGFSVGDAAKTALGLGLGVTPAGLALDFAGPVAGVAGKIDSAAAGVGAEVVKEIASMLGINGSAILLNIALIGGGAFLIYYGIAKAGGVSEPAQKLAGAVATSAKVATAAAPK